MSPPTLHGWHGQPAVTQSGEAKRDQSAATMSPTLGTSG